MKKIALTLAAIGALGLAACQPAQDDTTNNVQATDTGATFNEAETDVDGAAADANAQEAAENALDAAGNAIDNASDAVANAADEVTR